MIIKSQFKPAWWLPGAHAQTIYATVARKIKAPVDQYERIELPDGDFIDLAWSKNGLPETAPLVIVLHGLGGSVQSKYAAGLMQRFKKAGWRSVLMHFRGASAEPNRMARAYHSGDTADVNYILSLLAEREPKSRKAIVGVSLGGNVLLKWLGESGKQDLVDTAIAVSVPFELRQVAERIGTGFSKIYQSYLLRKLRRVFMKKSVILAEQVPEILHYLKTSQCFWTFDDKVTAPLHGFNSAHQYYRLCSSRGWLKKIATPTLIIHAVDDPFMTPQVVPTEAELSEQVTLEISRTGGHVGFISGSIPGKPVYWLEQRIVSHLTEILNNQK
ncbi:hydrolase [Legionella dresdenensis]|uniref:Hydrolase n=1 Tax=Legionella dresdenensis TaxID=450200 RepID=A0ABV8CER6_9GAMM